MFVFGTSPSFYDVDTVEPVQMCHIWTTLSRWTRKANYQKEEYDFTIWDF